MMLLLSLLDSNENEVKERLYVTVLYCCMVSFYKISQKILSTSVQIVNKTDFFYSNLIDMRESNFCMTSYYTCASFTKFYTYQLSLSLNFMSKH